MALSAAGVVYGAALLQHVGNRTCAHWGLPDATKSVFHSRTCSATRRKSRDDKTFMFATTRANPYVLAGAIVGGPKANDQFVDDREQFQYTEIALDYNAGLTLGLAGAQPPSGCSAIGAA
jgi:Glycosyl hydrolase family 9